MEEKVFWVDFDTLESFVTDVFVGVGIPKEDAEICADVLMMSDKRGIDSHGIGRLKPIYIDRIREEKTAIYIIIPEDQIRYFSLVINLFYTD